MYAVHSQAKIIILAVALNLKKAGEFEVSEPEALHTEEMLSELGVFFSCNGTREEYGLLKTRYIIGASMVDIDEALDSTGQGDHVRFGKAMDFPETAVDAFEDKKKLIPWNDHSRLTNEEKAFRFFRFSEEHFEEEIQWLEQIIAAVKQYSPAIYDEVMRSQ